MHSLTLDTNQNWFFKYKVYHILFWCVYNYLFWLISIRDPIQTLVIIFSFPNYIKFLFYVVFQAIIVYFNLYFLIPRFLEKSKFLEFFIYLIISLFCCASLIVTGYYLMAYVNGKTVNEQFGVDSNVFFHFLFTALTSTIASTTLAMSIKLTKNWIQAKRREQLLEKEKLETELKFLKYQFNPHFLFNTINSIFFLIHKNPDKASASLAKFSELLRYQLYECNDLQIPLSKEIAYLENFIELEKLRQNNNIKVVMQTDQGHIDNLAIAPFILMTFVENAFKHVSKDSDRPNWINIHLEVDDKNLRFTISNSTSSVRSNDVMDYGGIGLKNVQRRLDLIYPEQYHLDINNNTNTFEVKLQFRLTNILIPETIQKTA